ncbi:MULTISPECIES: alanine racemase [unclassified Janthinobacterium]|uniref:alanine racemase n=1 Tax=unclassified Janthinobacterium TaxID=2610881 RepID=UPI001614DBC8|nr:MULTISPECIES: alanine racemase [unclassified Janthinobacterium]MBB5607000.1 alanine racemase [Janthinobacterium sp. S3T4]MBB5612726.1 alanine racemase [Janthinobacterium sp. S3M3]
MPRPIVATIHLDAMKHNLACARASALGAKVWAVVKADAYGHGLQRAIQGFAEADGLALVEFDYALRLRAWGWTKPILMLEGFFDAEDLLAMATHGLNGTVHSLEQIALLEAARLPATVDIHLKMNTGMNRLGFTPQAVGVAYARLRAIPWVGEITLMTHFANADDAAPAHLPLEEQMERFEAGAASIPDPLPRSLSNSAGLLLHQLASDWVRPGIMLYGGTPGTTPAQDFGLLPTMTLRSRIIGIQDIVAGEVVGYGSRYEASGPVRVGVVACGYADGYPRHAPEGTPVLVDGVRTGLIGRVSMDMLIVDLTQVPGAQVGSTVTLWGEGMPIDEVALAAGTIGYELMCALAPRVPVVEA